MFMLGSLRTASRAGLLSNRLIKNVMPHRVFSSSVDLPSFGGGYLQTGHRDGAAKTNTRVLVTGAVGQLGTELSHELIKQFGEENVITSDVKRPSVQMPGQFIYLDVMNMDQLSRVVLENRIDVIVHYASILSALGEQNPQLALKLNTRGIENVLECARTNNLRVFAPSSIAVFGPSTPKNMTPNDTICRPTTAYGLTKMYVELLGEYYYHRYGVDFRSLRYPGIVSHGAFSGGGTTDYAVEIYHDAIKTGKYKCFLKPDTNLPMMYMPDCMKSTMMLLNADNSVLKRRVYNITGFSFNPADLVSSIQKFLPDFEIDYHPDFRQKIADSWPHSIDDSYAREEWGWKPDYDLDAMSEDMITTLKDTYKDYNPEIQE